MASQKNYIPLGLIVLASLAQLLSLPHPIWFWAALPVEFVVAQLGLQMGPTTHKAMFGKKD